MSATQELETIEAPLGTLVHVEGLPFVVGRLGATLVGRRANWELAMQMRRESTPTVEVWRDIIDVREVTQ